MTIQLNGEPHELPGPVTVAELLTSLAIDARLVAVEVDRQIVRRSDYATSPIRPGAEVEIVAFVGGG